eukprot:CAMPEP_0115115444 /NCGR_PEP_ID=MMETSP0227-20121206/42688_1 /TAXON_ID=89957 /ORGANISM="Polarella glacialis, Strain CCMP 1383" /LENGTH=85 /DNA_ID=CAMNT_0002516101 /DNA_START=89 /DNA_END=343 /DNA_ORIENTATION=-
MSWCLGLDTWLHPAHLSAGQPVALPVDGQNLGPEFRHLALSNLALRAASGLELSVRDPVPDTACETAASSLLRSSNSNNDNNDNN